MDGRLVAWARAVKSRRRWRGDGLPPLWLFTDAERAPDPRAAVARLPPGLCGVVLRHDASPGREALGRDLARICQARGIRLVVAGDPRLAARLGAGVHLRGGWGRAGGRFATASAHSLPELIRARRAGARLAFLSPAFPTASHPGKPPLGARRWAALALRATLPVAALGGVTPARLRALDRRVTAGAGGIGAFG